MNAREYLDILHVAERLKDTPRHCTTTKRRTESVAEHSWRISLMAFLLKHEFEDVDINKVVDMCLIHDLQRCRRCIYWLISLKKLEMAFSILDNPFIFHVR